MDFLYADMGERIIRDVFLLEIVGLYYKYSVKAFILRA